MLNLKKSSFALAVAGMFALGAAGGIAAQAAWSPAAHLVKTNAETITPVSPEEAHANRTGPVAMGSAPNYRAIFDENHEAVVGVTVDGISRPDNDADDSDDSSQQQQQQNPFAGTPFGQFFHGMPFPHGNAPMHGLGSGFIIRSDGLILTNAHVIDGARRVTVKLSDHREFKAKVFGHDKLTDIAVLKIDATGLPVVHMGDPRHLSVGDYVLAIGSPYGFDQSATAGIVSAKGRSLPGDGTVPFIQTDVAVNPGNSGGPLFDSSGAVVGINSQIYSNTGGYEGVSFAIPIDVALNVQAQLVAHGKVQHARLGVLIQPVNQMLANSFKLKSPTGVLVAKVEPNSAAAKAGLRPGDVILRANDQALTEPGQLSALVGLAKPGTSVKLDVWRDGKPLGLEANLGDASNAQTASADEPSAAGKGRLGLAVRPLSPDERRQSGLTGGLVVEDVSGPAADAGIQPGDVVLAVDGTPIRSAEQMRSLVGKDAQQVALLIQRGDATIFVPIPLS